ncbi:hypothetical protein X737_07255 [Mesorhizobium sp. L48C026A00]|nr:hypothetical protein X737_07255 [Mesorhizobium sp. L48C026A00]
MTIEQQGSLHRDEFADLKADFILANPPFNVPDLLRPRAVDLFGDTAAARVL